MGVRRYHVEREAIKEHHFPADEIKLVIPFMATTEPRSVDADTTGLKAFGWSDLVLPEGSLKHLKSAVAVVAYSWAATADGTIQLYDVDADVVRGESTTKTGGEFVAWETFKVTGLVEGNAMYFRANITVAGAAGETVTLIKAYLLLTLGVS